LDHRNNYAECVDDNAAKSLTF